MKASSIPAGRAAGFTASGSNSAGSIAFWQTSILSAGKPSSTSMRSNACETVTITVARRATQRSMRCVVPRRTSGRSRPIRVVTFTS